MMIPHEFCMKLQGYKFCPYLCFSQIAAERLPSADSGKISLGVFWFLPLLVGWFYCANLTASLTTVETQPPFNTLEELAEDTEYTLIVSGGSHRLILEVRFVMCYLQ